MINSNEDNKIMKYQEKIKQHLEHYKINVLGIQENGIWKKNKKPYGHILPEWKRNENIISYYRDFCEKLTKDFKLHSGFHHLNSSQAMCLNYFGPLIYEKKLSLVLDIISDVEEIRSGEFERESVIDRAKGRRPSSGSGASA